ALGVDGEGLLQAAGRGEGGGEGGAAAAVVAAPDPPRASSRAGRTVDDVDDADERGGAVHHRRRAAQDLDPLDVREVDAGEGGIEGAAPGHAVHDEEKSVELAQAPDLGHRAGGTGVASRSDRDAGGERQRGGKVGDAAVGELLAADDGDRGRDGLDVLGGPGGGHLDVLGDGGGRLLRLLLLRANAGRESGSQNDGKNRGQGAPAEGFKSGHEKISSCRAGSWTDSHWPPAKSGAAGFGTGKPSRSIRSAVA